jgi:hypothetical protein
MSTLTPNPIIPINIHFISTDTRDLPHCGYIDEEWTSVPARTKYMSDCMYTPSYTEFFVKRFAPEIDLTLTCVAQGDRYTELLESTKWYKTRANCYVHEKTLHRVRDEDDLDDCGPVPTNMDPRDHLPEPEPEPPVESTTPAWGSLQETHLPAPHRLAPRRMYNTTAGEEYVNCTEKYAVGPNADLGRVKRIYEFGQRIVLQCGEELSDPT